VKNFGLVERQRLRADEGWVSFRAAKWVKFQNGINITTAD
jgi:hypothetical protein